MLISYKYEDQKINILVISVKFVPLKNLDILIDVNTPIIRMVYILYVISQ